MIIQGYGVSLERLSEKDLELVREKRNSQTVSQFMEYREYITPEMQMEWFKSINNINNLYYVISYKNEKVGLINGRLIDWNKMETLSGGIFIWKDSLWQTNVPIMANMVLMDISVFLGLKRSFVKIMNSNTRAIQYNTLLGYEVWSDSESADSKIYVLEAKNYLEKTKIFRKYLSKQYGNRFETIIDDLQEPITQFLVDKINKMKKDDKFKMNMIFPVR